MVDHKLKRVNNLNPFFEYHIKRRFSCVAANAGDLEVVSAEGTSLIKVASRGGDVLIDTALS